ncbi:MAG TPA: hypothetical protein VH394_23615 [Thermoanaerobaculia bacterium]|jgi:hypothetical protein|nr:hypothetical protein [Thermoanaerobaculia bacterium]
MPDQQMNPSAVAWDWRRAGGSEDPDRKLDAATRRRGLIGGAVGLAAAAAIYLWWRPNLAYVVAGVSIVLTLLALAVPPAYRKVTGLLDLFAHVVGMAVTWVFMTLIYYVLFFPVGLLLRAQKKLAVTQHPDRRLPTYWSSTEGKPWTAESYRKQF